MHSTVAAFGRTRGAGLLCVNLAWLEGGPSGARFVCLLMFARGFGSQTAGRRMRQTSLSPQCHPVPWPDASRRGRNSGDCATSFITTRWGFAIG